MQTRFALPGVLVALAASALAEDLPPGYGVNTPNKSTFTTEISAGGDSDDYVFKGYPGMAVTATVKPSKGSTLQPEVFFVRPGGTVASEEEGVRVTAKGAARTASMTLDAAGWWQIRVRGVDLDPLPLVTTRSAGAYSITVKYGSPALKAIPSVSKTFKSSGAIDVKGDVDELRFQGYAGQTVSATLKVAPTLIPGIQLLRPDGSEAPIVLSQKGTKHSIAGFEMDQDGEWRVRIVGLEPTPDPDPDVSDATVGTYAATVKLSKFKDVPGIEPDANDQYRFTIAAGGGTTIGYTLSFTGAPPVFNSFVDPTGAIVPGFNGSTSVSSYTIPAHLPLGNYTLTFDAPATPPTDVSFTPRLTLPKGAKKVKRTLSADEPIVLNNSINPTAGGPGTTLIVGTNGKLVDPNDDDLDNLRIFLGHTEITPVTLTGTTLRGTVPGTITNGTYDVVVQSTTGQVGVKAGAFQAVDAPKALTIEPNIGTSAGGFEITIEGEGYRPGHMGITIDGFLVPVSVVSTTETSITFLAPPRSPTLVYFGVFDTETQLGEDLKTTFEYIATASISRLVPSLTTILGGDLIIVKGTSFASTDHVYLETATPGVYEEMSPGTFRDSTRHEFVAPPRPKGVYRVYVTDQFGQPSPPRTRNLTYFQFTNLSATGGVLPSGSDQWDGVTNAVGDFDQDGYDDLFISRVGGSALSAASETRVLRNDGTAHFTDVTAGVNGVMPAATSTDDWRADRVWSSDVNTDGFPDLVLVTNDKTALPQNRSHLRILVNEPRTGTQQLDRVFRDRTVELMPAVRTSSPLYGGGGTTVQDNWAGLDMWVGDVDKGAFAPPEILITHKDMREELDVGCGNYCASPYSSGYTYAFYWGGSRAFVWNKSAKGGQGQYRFEANFFPRKSGLRVQIFNPPPGVTIPICNSQYGSTCRGKFTPFTGKRIAVGDLNADGKPDVAVLSDEEVLKDGTTTSSLQVGINKFNPAEGSLVTDVTAKVFDLGGSFEGDTVEIGQTGFPSGDSFGVIATSQANAPGGGSVLRLIKFKTPSLPADVAEFEDISTASLPATGSNDKWQASRIMFRDVDNDGDQDMILVANAPPGGTEPAFRVLRNERVGVQVGLLRETLRGLITPLVTSNEHFEGDWFSIGDVNNDETLDFVLTRATTTQPAPQTRILVIDK